MADVVPCITVEDAESYKAAVDRIHPFASRVHIDISDGEFAPRLLLGADKLWWPQNWTVDIHAMVMRPAEYVDQLIALQPHTIIFHVEAAADLVPIIKKIQQAGIRAGVALQRSTVPRSVQAAVEAADHIMIFSGTLGEYGGSANLMQLEKVRLIKRINASAEIAWDGGITIDNIYTLTHGGVDVLNVGGTIARADDPESTYAKLVEETNKRGVI